MEYQHILFDVDASGVALIVVNRPEKLNALSVAVLVGLEAIFDRVAREEGIRAAILTGAGDRAFVAGADIPELAGQSAHEAWEFALGAGLELAMACTVRFASDNATLGLPEVRLGTTPGYGGTQRLPRLVGRGRALELLLSGQPIPAAEAVRIGLVNAVTSALELPGLCRAWLDKVLANGPVAVGLALEAVDTGLESGFVEGLRFEAAAYGMCAATEDRREGVRAFLEKRRPAFAGK
jgi:enoyl-CoA hydratase